MVKLNLLNPFCVFAIAATAFAGWVVYDARRPPAPRALNAVSDEAPAEQLNELVAIKGLGILRPGMSRPEVEEHLKPLLGGLSGEVGPVDLAAGYPTYRVRYRLSPGQSLPMATRARAGHTITITYDARTTGHPFISISMVPEGNGAATPRTSAA
jgi:hypothetical protein